MNVDLALVKAAAIDLARQSLYYFAMLRYPRMYKQDRVYLRNICNTLQDFMEDRILDKNGKPINGLILSAPPRHGKTLSIINLVQWWFGKSNQNSAIVISYNETLSGRTARAIRNGMAEPKSADNRISYGDIFPYSKPKQGDASYSLWSMEDSHFSFMATSPGATITGSGSRLILIDDLIKNALEANNERILEEHWNFYTDTLLSRIEAGGKQIIIQTRWCKKDLTGRLLEFEPDKWHVVTYPACINEDTHEMLCSDILAFEEYIDRRNKTDPQIMMANYQQEPYDNVDRLYTSGFKTYTERPEKFNSICTYVDTADEGDDSLCAIVYGVAANSAFVLDVIFTRDPMEKTEPETAQCLTTHKVDKAWIESNNGGRGFARNVERIMRERGNHHTGVEWFHQGENKQARILSNAASAMNSILFPVGWNYRWPKFYDELMRMGRSEKWKHDDAADALTGVVEKSLTGAGFAFF